MNILDNLPNSVALPQAEINSLLELHRAGKYEQFSERFLDQIFTDGWQQYTLEPTKDVLNDLYDKVQAGVRCVHSFSSLILKDAKKTQGLVNIKGSAVSVEEIGMEESSDAQNLLPTMSGDLVNHLAEYQEALREHCCGNTLKVSALDHPENGNRSDYFASYKQLADELLDAVSLKVNVHAQARPGLGSDGAREN